MVDTAWGIGLALVALVGLVSSMRDGQPARRATLAVASVIWGLRLAIYIGSRNRGQPEDPRFRDLWRYTRHPNYFGDFCMWWRLFLISLGSWVDVLTIVGPLLMTFLLTRGSGQRLTEQRMADRPQYADYVARTSGFIPLPPKRHAPADANLWAERAVVLAPRKDSSQRPRPPPRQSHAVAHDFSTEKRGVV